jgi:hypothetical protein
MRSASEDFIEAGEGGPGACATPRIRKISRIFNKLQLCCGGGAMLIISARRKVVL